MRAIGPRLAADQQSSAVSREVSDDARMTVCRRSHPSRSADRTVVECEPRQQDRVNGQPTASRTTSSWHASDQLAIDGGQGDRVRATGRRRRSRRHPVGSGSSTDNRQRSARRSVGGVSPTGRRRRVGGQSAGCTGARRGIVRHSVDGTPPMGSQRRPRPAVSRVDRGGGIGRTAVRPPSTRSRPRRSRGRGLDDQSTVRQKGSSWHWRTASGGRPGN